MIFNKQDKEKNNTLSEENALELKNINLSYGNKKILEGINFAIKKNEILGLLGLSGCGKSTLAKIICGIENDYTGKVCYGESRPIMIFQDPFSSLNRCKTVGFLLEEPLKIRTRLSKNERYDLVIDMLDKIGLSKEYYNRYPRELSGGERQRIGIGIALICGSKLLILDEPVSALDLSVQKKILFLLKELKEKFNLTYLLISHDIQVMQSMCDRIIVMNNGQIIEKASTDEVINKPKCDFTRELIKASMLEI